MELREFVKIFTDRKKLFFGVWLGIIILALLGWRFQPQRYEAALLLNVSRAGSEQTGDYRYDHFYRLQADERFADTVVRWLATPTVRSAIEGRSGARGDVIKTITGKRLSSQMIDIRYRSREKNSLQSIDTAITFVINNEAEQLNAYSKDPNWFIVVAEKPTISDARIHLWQAIIAGIAFGLFLAFWTVMIRWYWKKSPSSSR